MYYKLENQTVLGDFPVKVNPLNLWPLNQTKHIFVVLTSSSFKIWGKSVQGFMSKDQTSKKTKKKQILLLYIYNYFDALLDVNKIKNQIKDGFGWILIVFLLHWWLRFCWVESLNVWVESALLVKVSVTNPTVEHVGLLLLPVLSQQVHHLILTLLQAVLSVSVFSFLCKLQTYNLTIKM